MKKQKKPLMTHLADYLKSKKENDAGLVNDYYQKALKVPTRINEQRYDQLQNWFCKKYGVLWLTCLSEEEGRKL